MTYYILQEIVEQYEGEDKITILEINENKEILEFLANRYTDEKNQLSGKIKRAKEMETFIYSKLIKEFPEPELIEQEELPVINRGSLTKEQQRIRSKIGTLNATKIQENLKLRDKLRSEEVKKLSEDDKECLSYLNDILRNVTYVVEKFECKKPQFVL